VYDLQILRQRKAALVFARVRVIHLVSCCPLAPFDVYGHTSGNVQSWSPSLLPFDLYRRHC